MRCIYMRRYTLKFKLAVVEYFLSGRGGHKATAKKFGTNHSAVRIWVAAFKKHGVSGLEPPKRNFTAEFKESVILYMRENGLSMRETATHFNILSVSSIGLWERCYDAGGLQALAPRKRGRSFAMKPTITKPLPSKTNSSTLSPEEMQRELDYLRAENACLKKLHALIQQQLPNSKKR
jgi:transposase